jgi:ATP-binding cassette subfamily A (ABC1) protein 5
LLILIVGEKEKKIKEGMKIMGLRDSVFWWVNFLLLFWSILYNDLGYIIFVLPVIYS